MHPNGSKVWVVAVGTCPESR